MNDSLNIVLAQIDSVWHSPEQNFTIVNELLKSVHKPDILVLPEMWATGYSMDISQAQKMGGNIHLYMQELAISRQCLVIGSIMISENNQYFNRLLCCLPNGDTIHYDKKHLFSLAGEEKIFTAGTEKIVVEYKRWRICPLICYDLRFPEWCRNIPNSYDVLLFVASWPQKRIHHWDALLQARAIENQSYVVACNRTGNDANEVLHTGHSSVYSPAGEKIVYSVEKVQLVEATLSYELLLKNRRLFKFLKDA